MRIVLSSRQNVACGLWTLIGGSGAILSLEGRSGLKICCLVLGICLGITVKYHKWRKGKPLFWRSPQTDSTGDLFGGLGLSFVLIPMAALGGAEEFLVPSIWITATILGNCLIALPSILRRSSS